MAVHLFDNGHVEKQPEAWKEYHVEYWLKELLESMDRYTVCRDITERSWEYCVSRVHLSVPPFVYTNLGEKNIFLLLLN